MIDIKFLRENPDVVKENIKKKFQDHKLVLVDEVIELDNKNREVKLKGDELRSKRNSLSSQIGILMKNGNKDEAEKIKEEVRKINDELVENEKLEAEYEAQVTERMMKIPNIIHDSVPIGKDLMGDVARLHSAVLTYARDFMIDKGFTYCIPPYMIRADVVTGVMSFEEMDAMMYKIEGEDLYLIGTSEHSMMKNVVFIEFINLKNKK